MRVTHVIKEFYPALGGGPIATFRRVKELERLGVENTVITGNLLNPWTNSRIETGWAELNGVKVLRLPAINPHPYYTIIRHITKHLLDGRPDLIHLYGYGSYSTEVSAMKLRRSDIPIVFSPCGYFPLTKDLGKIRTAVFESFSKRNTLMRANRIFVDSNFEIGLFSRLAHYTKIVKIPGPSVGEDELSEVFEPDKFRTKYNIWENYFISIGRINVSKGFQNVIRSISEFNKLNHENETRFVIAGTDQGYVSELLDLARKYGVEKQVVIIPNLPEDFKFPALSGASAFLLPSFIESYGGVVGEAMAVGTPVVVTKFGGAHERVINTQIGKAIDPENSKEMVSALNWALSLTSAQRQNMKTIYHNILREGHTVESSARLAFEQYREILGDDL